MGQWFLSIRPQRVRPVRLDMSHASHGSAQGVPRHGVVIAEAYIGD